MGKDKHSDKPHGQGPAEEKHPDDTRYGVGSSGNKHGGLPKKLGSGKKGGGSWLNWLYSEEKDDGPEQQK